MTAICAVKSLKFDSLFFIIQKYNSAYEAKIQEALITKKQSPKLNKPLQSVIFTQCLLHWHLAKLSSSLIATFRCYDDSWEL